MEGVSLDCSTWLTVSVRVGEGSLLGCELEEAPLATCRVKEIPILYEAHVHYFLEDCREDLEAPSFRCNRYTLANTQDASSI